jgi:hypothetical protein
MRDNQAVTRSIDPEGAHIAALRRLADFRGRRVPEAEDVARARRSLPASLRERVAYRVASAEELEVEPGSFDLVLFSWSL